MSQKNALSESSLRSYNPSKPTSLASRLQAASLDLSDVSACRMMILKVRFFWDTLYIHTAGGQSVLVLCTSILLWTLLDLNGNTLALMMVPLCLIYSPVWCPVSVRSEESAQETKYLHRLSKLHLTRIAKKMIFFNFWKNQKLEKFWNLFSCFSCFLLFSYLKNDRKFFIIFELFAQISRL